MAEDAFVAVGSWWWKDPGAAGSSLDDTPGRGIGAMCILLELIWVDGLVVGSSTEPDSPSLMARGVAVHSTKPGLLGCSRARPGKIDFTLQA